MPILRYSRRLAGYATIVIMLGACDSAARVHAQVPANLDMEEGTPGEAPVGWREGNAAWKVILDTTAARAGRSSLSMQGGSAQGFGNASQSIPAAPYRGMRVRYTGWVKVAAGSPQTNATLWLRVDRPDGTGFFDNMGDRPIRWATWRQYTIIGDVAPDADRIYFGMMQQGVGRTWLDDVAFEVLGPTPVSAAEKPRALSARGLENLTALARMIGYVRYFHPSDGAADTDWNAFTIDAVRRVEPAADARALRDSLVQVFREIAPTVIVSTGSATGAQIVAPRGSDRVRHWIHNGLGVQTPSAYRSTRAMTMIGAGIPDSIPDPRRPASYAAGGGVHLTVPIAVFADADGTLPRSTSWKPVAGAMPAPTRAATSADDRATRIAAAILAWNVFQHFYPYFDVVDADWPAELPRALRSAATDAGPTEFLVTMRRMVAALQDGHGNVTQQDITRASSAIPALRWDWIENSLVITAVGEGVTDVAPGDVVLQIGGEPAADVIAREEALISGATAHYRRASAVSRLVQGPQNRPLELTVRGRTGSTKRVSIARDARAFPQEKRPAPIAELTPGIMYVDLDRATTAAFREAVPRLAAARGIIFDLRGYPRQIDAPEVLRHLISDRSVSAGWNIPILTRPDQESVKFARSNWDLRPLAPHFNAQRVFLTSATSISYAESVMGIVEHYKLADIVGTTTAGTNGNINPFEVPGGFQVIWTGMKVLKQDGTQHHGVGIAPTLPVSRTISGVASGEDEVLNAALRLLQNRATPKQ